MDGGLVQKKIQYGYAKCASKIGAPFMLYRAQSPINPISPANQIGIILCSSNVSWEYMTTQKYGKAVWNLIIDTQTQNLPLAAMPGDYLIPVSDALANDSGFLTQSDQINWDAGYGTPDIFAVPNQGLVNPNSLEDKNIYFIGDEQFLQPILGVQCNRTIEIIRPTQTVGAGYKGYSEYLPETSITIASGMPASVLSSGSGGSPPTKLPTDEKEPRWIILIPNLGDIFIRVDDIVIDEFNQEYVITDNELTSLGWRIWAEQVVNSR